MVKAIFWSIRRGSLTDHMGQFDWKNQFPLSSYNFQNQLFLIDRRIWKCNLMKNPLDSVYKLKTCDVLAV